MAQLRSQFVAVVMERDLARTFRGKISPVTTLDVIVSFRSWGKRRGEGKREV